MSTQLDIDDVCAGNPLAEKELAKLREIRELLAEARYFMAVGHAPFCTEEALLGKIEDALK